MFATISDHLEKTTFPKLAVAKVPFLEDAVQLLALGLLGDGSLSRLDWIDGEKGSETVMDSTI